MGVARAIGDRVVFLDRDGVINRTYVRDGVPRPPATVGGLEILPGVPEALDRLRAAGYRLIVVTNQPDVARGTVARETVEAIHERLRTQLALDEIRVCYHDDADGCQCRKPKPGLLRMGAPVDFSASVMVGDRWRDIEAGRAAGCLTILVSRGDSAPLPHDPDVRVSSLLEAADWIVANSRQRS
jgi:D-glycero-D-manno-heptose 1,7-bisphosphate phosphatase